MMSTFVHKMLSGEHSNRAHIAVSVCLLPLLLHRSCHVAAAAAAGGLVVVQY